MHSYAPRPNGLPKYEVYIHLHSASKEYENNPDKAIELFEWYFSDEGHVQDEVAEGQLVDPLILAGDAVVPLVVKEVRKRDMPGRSYAIWFLGNGQHRNALPELEGILSSPDEGKAIKGDALRAICNMDRSLCEKYCGQYAKDDSELGRLCRDIIKANYETHGIRRTRDDVLSGNF